MANMYNDKVMDHFMNPHNVGEIENADGVGTYGSPVCGDMMKISLSIDENEVITDAKFKTFGCGSAIASSSMATGMIIGKSVEEASVIIDNYLAMLHGEDYDEELTYNASAPKPHGHNLHLIRLGFCLHLFCCYRQSEDYMYDCQIR